MPSLSVRANRDTSPGGMHENGGTVNVCAMHSPRTMSHQMAKGFTHHAQRVAVATGHRRHQVIGRSVRVVWRYSLVVAPCTVRTTLLSGSVCVCCVHVLDIT